MRSNKSVSLLCWAYNEEENIIIFLERATKLLEDTFADYEIILINDGSADKTLDFAENFKKLKNNKIKIFSNDKNMNVAYSFKRALKEASKEYLFWQTVDWSYDISKIGYYLKYLDNYDVIQGVRRKPIEVKVKFLKPLAYLFKIFGIKYLTKRSDTISKAIISVVNYSLIRLLFQVPVSDYQNITIYPTKWLQSIIKEADSSFGNPELIIKAYWSGLRIKEVPINFIPRDKGQAKGTKLKSILKSIRDIFEFWFKWVILNQFPNKKKGIIDRTFNNEYNNYYFN